MKATHGILLLGLMVFLAGCATDNSDNPLRGRLITDIYPAFNAFNLPFYVNYTADRFELEKLPEVKECNMNEDGSFKIIPANSSGNDKYLIVNRFGRIIEAKGFK
jgi:hypothetical protein